MGRVTEFIDFINRKPKPTPLEMKTEYTSLTLTYKIQDIRKQNLKKRQVVGFLFILPTFSATLSAHYLLKLENK